VNVRNLDRNALLYRFADHRLADVDVTILDLADDRIVSFRKLRVGEILGQPGRTHRLRLPQLPESCVALATMVFRTTMRSTVEFTAWLTSPSARSSSTD